MTPDECPSRIGGHEWDDPDDTDEAPSSYCVACGMQGRDYQALRALRKRIEGAKKAMLNAKANLGMPRSCTPAPIATAWTLLNDALAREEET